MELLKFLVNKYVFLVFIVIYNEIMNLLKMMIFIILMIYNILIINLMNYII